MTPDRTYTRPNGVTVNIYRDEDPQSPDDWGNDDVFLVAFHRDFYVKRDGWSRDVDPHDPETYDADTYVVIPLKAYIHGGVSLHIGSRTRGDCQWDTSNVGYIVINKAAWGNTPPGDWINVANALVDEWNQYLCGDVWGFILTAPDGTEVGSCWGFYGRDYIEAEANAEADTWIAPERRLLL